MLHFVIETAYRLPWYRQHSYQAESLEAACALAIADKDWDCGQGDEGACGDTYVTGAWMECDPIDWDSSLPVPPQFDELLQRKADQFHVLLGLLKVLPQAPFAQAPDSAAWRDSVATAIAEAEAILTD